MAGQSDVWVTAFIAAHLRGHLERAVDAQTHAFLLACRLGDGMWSYGHGVPSDADSTAWCLLALKGTRGRAGLTSAARRQALDGIWSRAGDDGVATFAADGAIAAYIGASASQSTAGWTAGHPDVTAAAVLASVADRPQQAESALAHLIARQTAAGWFDAYWWRGPHYTTTLMLRALELLGRRLERERAAAVLHALQREQMPDGGFGLGSDAQADAFTTALALESLSHLSYLGGAQARRAAALALLKAQQADGHWAGGHVLRLPAPEVVDPRHVGRWMRDGRGGNSYVLDRDGLFATAVACHSLALLQRTEAGQNPRQARPPVLAAAPGSTAGAEAVELQVSAR